MVRYLLLTITLVAYTVSSLYAQPYIIPGTDGKDLPTAPAPEPSFTLALLPDRTTGRDWGLPYLEQAVKDINLINPDAVFTIGDMVQGYTRSMEHYQSEVDEYLAIVKNLTAPFYPLPGNHDVIPGTRNSSDKRFEKEYQRRMGPLYYAVFLEELTVISLYTDENLESKPTLSNIQTKWVLERINEALSKKNPLVILMHKPVWRYRNSNWDPIHNKLAEAVQAGVKVIVIAGHFHSMQREPDIEGVEYHLVGTCGASIDQHPLGGQLQHFTIIKATASGKTNVYHQPIGCVLPDDFILAADQDRAFDIRNAGDKFEFDSVIDQPYGRPVRQSLQMKVNNPIDRPVTLSATLAKSQPDISPIANYGFYGKTNIDAFNPYATNVDTPFNLDEKINPLIIQPGESGILTIPLKCLSQSHMLPPPQLNITATFTDDQNREVPVYIYKRIPLRMRYTLTESLALDMPISAWDFNVYDTLEADSEMGMSAEEGKLNLAFVVYDNVPCFDDKVEDVYERLNNPASDAIRLTFGNDKDQKIYLIEPMNPVKQIWQAEKIDDYKKWKLNPVNEDIQWQCITSDTGYGLVVQIPLELVGQPGQSVEFNVGIADNDDTYHTQWRYWSAQYAGSTIVLPQQF